MQIQGACSEIWGDQLKNNYEITTEVQGNYLNFKQNLAEKENFVISKINESQPLFSISCIRAASFQKLTAVCLVNIRESGNKNLPKKPCFLDNFSQKNRLKEF